jgi:hypothetical protein
MVGELGMVALTSLASIALRTMPRSTRLPAGLAVAGTTVAVARRHDASWTDLGMDVGDVGDGIRWGVGVGSAIAAAIGVATRWPSVRDRFADERIAAHSPARAAYELVARIPFETALAEELIFRAALLGIGLSRRSTPAALAVSSALFGLWHVVPTWQDMSRSAVGAAAGEGPAARAGAVIGVVAATAGAGAAFGLLRLRSRSVLAPVIVHATLNQVSFSVARSAARAAASRTTSESGTSETVEATDR